MDTPNDSYKILKELESYLQYIRIRFPSQDEGAYILFTDINPIKERRYNFGEVLEHFYPDLYQRLSTFLFGGYKKSGLSIKENLDLHELFSREYGVSLHDAVLYVDTVFGKRRFNKDIEIKWQYEYS